MPSAHCTETKYVISRFLFEQAARPMPSRHRRNRRWRTIKPLALALGTIFGTTLATAAMAFPVTWTFFETGCTSVDGGCQNLQLPAAEGELSLPDIDSSGSYSFHSPATETGDTDFFLDFANRLAPVLENPPGCTGAGPLVDKI